jgi:hypothetical protein
MATFLEIATPLIQRGIPVIPVQPNEKRCLLPEWQKKATTEIEQLKLWQTENPNFNVGCVGRPDGFVMLDCDIVGLREQIENETGQKFPLTLIVRSAGKGAEHIYFRQTDASRRLGNRSSAGLFDLQSVDKYVVGAGSTLANGKTYEIVEDSPIADFPDWLAEWIELHSDVGKGHQGGKGAPVNEDFDFDRFCDHFGFAFIGDNDSKYFFESCPYKGDFHTSGGKPDYPACAIFYDGETIGFSDLATSCEGNGKTIGDLIRFRYTQEYEKYDGKIFADEDTEELIQIFGAEAAGAEESAPLADELPPTGIGKAGKEFSNIRLNARQNKILDQKKKKERERERISEENFGGYCRGDCGKTVVGTYFCDECKKRIADKNFALQPGEVELYRGNVGKKEDKIVRQIVVKDAASIEMEEMLWLWPNRIPEGAITWIMGQPNNAKSLLTIEIAKCATTGTDWPDGTPNTMGKCKVLMYCGEDSLSKVVIPRLKAAGADLGPGMIGFMDRKSFRTIAGDNSPEKRPLDLGEDLDTLLELAKKHPDVKMIIVDPITGVFGNKSINKNEEANPILEKLIDFCESTGIAFVGVTHVPKRSTNSAIEKIAGGSAVGGSAKSAFMLSRDPDSDDVHDHLLTMVKWNYTGEASGMKYSTVPAEVEHKGKKLKIAKIAWGESTDLIADDVLVAQNSKKDDRDRQQDKCDAWLSAYLGDTPRKSKDVYTAAEAQGYGTSTVKRSIENLKGRHIDGRKVGMGAGWWMALPGVNFPAPKEEKLIALAADEGL